LSKAPSPLLGFNNNIRHKGRVFHVQTEDSGVRHPHIITHLFMDGGRILKTTKTSYAEHLNQEGMGEIVRKMMKEQHKAMFVALRNGDFDEIIIKHFGSVSPEDAPAQVAEVPPDLASGAVPPPPPASPSAPVRPPSVASPASAPERPLAAAPPPPAPPPSAPPPPAPSPAAPPRPPSVPPRSMSPPPGGRVPFASDLPPPPPNVLKSIRPEGGYREVRPEVSSTYSEINPPPESRSSSRLPAARPRPASGRHVVARPSLSSQRPPDGGSIFGDDVNEKSLDEVILSYLAEDLEPPPGNSKK
jgi:hypothetical protein